MKLFRVLVLVVALAAGGIAAYLALNMGPTQLGPTVVELAPQIQSQDVLVAAADLSQGDKLNAENVRWQTWPEDALNPTYIQKQTTPDAIETLKGSVVRSQFVAGEPIREVKLAKPGSGFLSAILSPGMRAIAVRVSAESAAGGFVLPNDRVDVIQTITQQASPNTPGQNVSRTILTNVKVLAVDQTVDETGGESVVVGKTATLELDPSQVEVITAAEASGTLSLALRSFADAGDVAVTTIQPVVVTPESPKPTPPPVGPRTSSTVRIFRNGRLQEFTIGGGAGANSVGAETPPRPEPEPEAAPDDADADANPGPTAAVR